MKRRRLIALSAVFVIAITTLLIFSESVPVSAQNKAAPAAQPPPPPLYNPYPPGILPPDLTQEVDRVLREIRGIENEALGQWHTLGPVTYTGNPPIIQGNGYEAMRILGKLMNYDQNISPFRNEACASCHMPYAGFSGPIPSVNLTMIAYPGTEHFRLSPVSCRTCAAYQTKDAACPTAPLWY